MTQRNQLFQADAIGEFALAGKATLTLCSAKTQARYTFKVEGKANNGSDEFNIWFVSVLYGADNESDYAYLGFIKKNELEYVHGRKSKINEDDKRNKAFVYFWQGIRRGRLAPQLDVWHEGRCGRCNRKLTVPESIASGIGPECAKHL